MLQFRSFCSVRNTTQIFDPMWTIVSTECCLHEGRVDGAVKTTDKLRGKTSETQCKSLLRE